MSIVDRLAVLTILLGSLPAQTPATTAPQDTLWMKAAACIEAGGSWLPGMIVIRMEDIDGKGAAKSSWEEWMAARNLGDGQYRYETVRIVEDGRDLPLTEDGAEPAEDEGFAAADESDGQDQAAEESTSFSYSLAFPPIFAWQGQDLVAKQPRAGRKTIDGRSCVGYEFTVERDQATYRETLTGMAWLDEQAGNPVEVVYTSRPLPRRIKKAVTTVRYRDTPDGATYPVSLVIEGTGGFLFFKKSFRMSCEHRDHFRSTDE